MTDQNQLLLPTIRRGDIVRVFLDGCLGTEIQNHGDDGRPCLIVQNDRGNRACGSTIVAPLRDASSDRGYRETVAVPQSALSFVGSKDSVVQCGQLRTVDRRLRINAEAGVLCHLPSELMHEVDAAIRHSLGLAS